MDFKGPAKRLDDIDLPRVGRAIGVGEDEIHAIIEVETQGGGFDPDGRPRILFEPHVFYRNLTEPKRSQAVRAGLACRTWGQVPYGKPSQQYERLQAAMRIDETAALKSCSWGLGRILGENHVAAGYATVQEMVADFTLDEDDHLEAMIRFVKAHRLDDEIRAHNWAGFARGYNGPQYKQNAYDLKLAAAYAKWSKIKNTPWDGTDVPPPPDIPKPEPAAPAASGGFYMAVLKAFYAALRKA